MSRASKALLGAIAAAVVSTTGFVAANYFFTLNDQAAGHVAVWFGVVGLVGVVSLLSLAGHFANEDAPDDDDGGY